MRNTLTSDQRTPAPGKSLLRFSGILLIALAVFALIFGISGLFGVDITGTIYLEAAITDAMSIPETTEYTRPDGRVTNVPIWTTDTWEAMQEALRSARAAAADGGVWTLGHEIDGPCEDGNYIEIDGRYYRRTLDTSQGAIDAAGNALRAAINGLALTEEQADADRDAILPSGRAIDVYFAFVLLFALFQLVTGFLGLKFCGNEKKARLLGILGVIGVGFTLAVFFFTAGTLGYTLGWMMLAVVAIPALLVWGARRNDKKVATVIIFGILVLLSGVVLFPVWWMIRSSLMTLTEVATMSFLPSRWLFSNYALALEDFHFFLYLRNTLTIAVPSVVLGTGTAILCGYSFARFRFRGKKFIFGLCIASMLLPPMVTLIPIFIVWTSFFEMANSFWPLIIPWICGGGAFNIFLMRQFILTIPRELDEAAMIDGAGRLRILFLIIIPAIKPAIMVVGIFIFMQIWNDLLTQMVYLSDADMATMALGLQVFSGSYGTMWNLTMVAAVLAIIPALLIYIFGQKYLVEGIVMTGMKN